MKKTLLLLMTMLAAVGMMMAQDVYYAGYYTNSSGKKIAAVYKNGEKQHQLVGANNTISTSAVPYSSDIYWTVNYRGADGNTDGYADVYKNGSVYLNSKTQGRYIYKLFKGYGNIYAVGYKRDENNVKKAVVWKNDGDEVYKAFGTGDYTSEATCGAPYLVEGSYFVVGGAQYTASSYNGVIWTSNGNKVLYTLPDKTYIFGIAVYDGNVYSVGSEYVNSNRVAKVWKNNTELYALTDGSKDALALGISVDGGDVYVSGWDGTSLKVWKNGAVFYNNGTGTNSNLWAVKANSGGVYFAESKNNQGRIYKDNTQIFAADNCEFLYDIYVNDPTCSSTAIRTLPFTETFDRGSETWPCWTRIDKDANNNGYASSWMMGGKSAGITTIIPYAGDNYARHTHNIKNAQEGWLVSPRLFLQPGRDYTDLEFYYKIGWTYSSECASVWISTGNSPSNTDAFVKLGDLVDKSAWTRKSFSLKQYQGQAVYIAFKYSADASTTAPSFNIDNFKVTESWNPCSSIVTEFPFEDGFNNGLNNCWYNLDIDHSGNQACWQWQGQYTGVKHPAGTTTQTGWLITQRIQLKADKNYTLGFYERILDYDKYTADGCSVWIALDKTGVPNTSDYVKIWAETDASSNGWRWRNIDLSQYAGHTVNIAFRYYGYANAHTLNIDDVKITETIPQYTVSAESNNPSWGTASGGGTFNMGTSVTLIATPASGYEFQKWTKDGTQVSTDATYTFTLNATTQGAYKAWFANMPMYTITGVANPTEGGSVTGGTTVTSGQTVTLTAVPNTGYEFTGWDDGNTDNPRTVTVTGNKTYTANFSLKQFKLTVLANPEEGGSVEGDGTYAYGTEVEIKATANDDYEFLNWNDGSLENPRTITVTQDETYIASFTGVTITTYTITAIPDDVSMGSVEGGGTFPKDTEIDIKAIPFGINKFVKWDDGNVANPRHIVVTEDHTYRAIFETPELYTITVVSENPTMGTVTGGGDYPMGQEVTIEATPIGDNYFKEWNDGNTQNPRTITVTGPATYTAKFSSNQIQTYALTVTCNPNHGYTEPNGQFNYPEGTVVTIKATPWDDSYAFDHWNDGDTQNPRTITVTENLTFVALFKQNVVVTTHTITVESANPEMGTVSGGGTFAEGTEVTIKATPKEGYLFDQWNDGDKNSTRKITVTEDKTYTASFKEALVYYNITVVSEDPNKGTATGGGQYVKGQSVTIQAIPNEGYLFNEWKDGSTENPRQIVVEGDATYVAGFMENDPTVYYTVTVEANDAEMGTVAGGGNEFKYGDVVTITATPNEGFVFMNWNDGNTDNPREITVIGDVTYTATFSGLGVDELVETALTVYPNPVKDVVRISGLENETEIQVFNSVGKMVKIIRVNADEDINVSDLSAGFYMIRCGKQTLRFVKE